MPQRILRVDANGNIAEIVPTVTSTGAAQGGDVVALGSDGLLDPSLLPPDVGAAAYSVQASESLSAGDFVNIWVDNGDVRVRRADASGVATRAHGYVTDSVNSGETATVYTDFKNGQLSGLTPGATYFLSATVPGGITTAAPSTTGQIRQVVGIAFEETVLDVEIDPPVIRA